LSGVADNAIASTITVSNCTESALRSVVAAANENSGVDTIDMTGLGLSCSTITLTSGDLVINGFDMTLLGPTDHALTIDAAKTGRVVAHTGHGTIVIDHLTVANGSPPSYRTTGTLSSGGCIRSSGSVRLIHSTVSGCHADNGAGVYAVSGVEVHYSQISGNRSYNQGGGLLVKPGNSLGAAKVYSSTIVANAANVCGGASAYTIVMTDSVVTGNFASYLLVDFNSPANGGGICGNDITLTTSTVTTNYAPYLGGGIYGNSVTIVQSTIDTNSANRVGAIYANNLSVTSSTISGNSESAGANVSCNNLTLINSTVAFNHSIDATAGIFVATSAQITSSIVARNYVASSSGADDLAIVTGAPVTASANLIVSSNLDTGSLKSDPQLTPLAFHGGPTRTHALQATSPAINAGNADGLTTDQRGTGFARVVGAKADIGAYERQLNDDEIFYGGFD
jgi:hypothetical protein